MKRLAENQATAKAARGKYVCDMNVFVRLQRANGKRAREESRDYIVAPSASKSSRTLLRVAGRVFGGKKEFTCSAAGCRTKDMDIDEALTKAMAKRTTAGKERLSSGKTSSSPSSLPPTGPAKSPPP